ncbi:hypothetical protein ABPG77_004505 [Micractinium sp. CCAP 211/92]
MDFHKLLRLLLAAAALLSFAGTAAAIAAGSDAVATTSSRSRLSRKLLQAASSCPSADSLQACYGLIAIQCCTALEPSQCVCSGSGCQYQKACASPLVYAPLIDGSMSLQGMCVCSGG